MTWSGLNSEGTSSSDPFPAPGFHVTSFSGSGGECAHSCFTQSESNDEATQSSKSATVDSSDDQDFAVDDYVENSQVPICFRPSKINYHLKSPQCWRFGRLGPYPCPLVSCRLHHRDTLMFQVPQTIYSKMVSWGNNEIAVCAQRRVRVRESVFGIAASDASSEFIIKLTCAVVLMSVVYEVASVSFLLGGRVVPRDWWYVLAGVLVICKHSCPYFMGVASIFGAVYVAWIVAWIVVVLIKLLILVAVVIKVMQLVHGEDSTTLDQSAIPKGILNSEAKLPHLTIAVPTLAILILVDALNLVAAVVLRQVSALEERLIRVVDIHEKTHKRLNVAPFELWFAGLYSEEKGMLDALARKTTLTTEGGALRHRKSSI